MILEVPSWVGIPLRNHRTVRLEAAVDTPPATMAVAAGLELEQYLADVKRWAELEGMPHGLRVNLEAGTITQAGR